MLPIRCPYDGSVIVAQVFACEETRPVGKDDIIVRKAFLGERRRRDDENRAGAETEGKDRTVAGSEAGKGAVKGFLEQVEMAENGEAEGGRW